MHALTLVLTAASPAAETEACAPLVLARRRFGCGEEAGKVWRTFRTSRELRAVVERDGAAYQHLLNAEAWRSVSVLGTTAAAVGGVWVVVDVASNINDALQGEVAIEPGLLEPTAIGLLAGGLVVAGASRLASRGQLRKMVVDYNLRPVARGLDRRRGLQVGLVADVRW